MNVHEVLTLLPYIFAVPPKPVRQPSRDDELTFSGVPRAYPSDHIPSKSFQRLRKMTGSPVNMTEPDTLRGGSEIDTTSIRANFTGGLYRLNRKPAGPSTLPVCTRL